MQILRSKVVILASMVLVMSLVPHALQAADEAAKGEVKPVKEVVLEGTKITLLNKAAAFEKLGEKEKAFVAAYVEAINSKDAANVKKLVHPASLACMNDKNKDYYSDYFKRAMGKKIPEKYRVGLIDSAKVPSFLPKGLSFPVEPTHTLALSFVAGGEQMTSINYLALDKDALFNVVVCVDEAGLATFRGVKKEKAKKK